MSGVNYSGYLCISKSIESLCCELCTPSIKKELENNLYMPEKLPPHCDSAADINPLFPFEGQNGELLAGSNESLQIAEYSNLPKMPTSSASNTGKQVHSYGDLTREFFYKAKISTLNLKRKGLRTVAFP